MLALLVAASLSQLRAVGKRALSTLIVAVTLGRLHTLAVGAANVLLILRGAIEIGMAADLIEFLKGSFTRFHI